VLQNLLRQFPFSNYLGLALFFLLFSHCSQSYSDDYIQSIEYLEDTSAKLEFEEAISRPLQKSQSIPTIRFGFSTSVYWIRVNLKQNLPENENIFLEIGNPRLNHISFYYYEDANSAWKETSLGRFTPIEKREFKSQNYILPVKPSSSFPEVWIRVASETEILVPIGVTNQRDLYRYKRGEEITKAWVSGFNILISILAFVGFFLFRKMYLLYATLYIFFLNLSIIENENIAGDFVSFSRILKTNIVDQITRYLAYFFGGLFAIQFIYKKEIIGIRPGQFLFFINIPLLFSPFFLPFMYSAYILTTAVLLEIFYIIISCISFSDRSPIQRVLFSVAWSVAFFGFGYHKLWKFNILPDVFSGGIHFSYLSSVHLFLIIVSVIMILKDDKQQQLKKDHRILELEMYNLEQKDRILEIEKKTLSDNLQAQQIQNEFIRFIALSFKEPLHNIEGISESLISSLGGNMSFTQIQSMLGILQSSRLLRNAINDLSDYSLMQAGKLELKKVAFDINILAEIVISAVSPLAGNKNLLFVNNVQESLPLVEADEERLQLILYNLLYSSIQNATFGDISLKAVPIPGFVNLFITYKGAAIDIPMDEIDFSLDFSTRDFNPVYNRFFNLMVTAKLIYAHGGDLEVKQEEDHTIIRFSIPVAKDQFKSVVPRKVFKKDWAEYELNSHFKTLPTQADHEGYILIVDDEALNLETYRNYLESMNYKVNVCSSGREALLMVNKQVPDLMIVDMIMPYMSGATLCRLLREKYDKVSLPILLLTNKFSNSDLMETMDLANDYLMKPLNREKLIVRVKNLLNLSRSNMAYKRFVPKEILGLLGKSNIYDVKLGDQVQKEMTVLFSDLRSYTRLSESMSPEESFEFLNSYLRRVGPMVRKHNGFIDKYMGDAIMAIFPKSPDDAVRSAIDIQKSITKYNKTRVKNGGEPISAGIGIHTGDVILGIIGEEERMEGTVVSDAVNLSSRLENLTKLYNASILITMDTFLGLDDQEEFNFRILDRVKVKGKEKFVTVIEIIDGYEDARLDALLNSKIYFEEGVTRYLNKEFQKGLALFQKFLEFVPDDKAAKIYIQRSLYYMEHNVPMDWDGVEVLEEKIY
jgi:class 3 adenylate cyclase/CheY-like chemotaxis protein